MHRKPFVNRSESRTLDLLERSLRGTVWQVHVKTGLKEVLGEDDDDWLDQDQRNILKFGHLDFLVINLATSVIAEFAVEFDGPSHFDPVQERRDRAKDEVCLRAGLPLLRIDSDMIGEKEQISVLEWVVDRFVARHRGTPESTTIFPAIERAAERLETRYGLVPSKELRPSYPTDEWMERWRSSPLLLTYIGLEEHLDHLDGQQYDEVMLGFEEHDYLFSLAVYRPADDATLLEVRGRSPIPNQPAAMRELLEAKIGTDVDALGRYLAEYTALIEVERWADRTLLRRDEYP